MSNYNFGQINSYIADDVVRLIIKVTFFMVFSQMEMKTGIIGAKIPYGQRGGKEWKNGRGVGFNKVYSKYQYLYQAQNCQGCHKAKGERIIEVEVI